MDSQGKLSIYFAVFAVGLAPSSFVFPPAPRKNEYLRFISHLSNGSLKWTPAAGGFSCDMLRDAIFVAN